VTLKVQIKSLEDSFVDNAGKPAFCAPYDKRTLTSDSGELSIRWERSTEPGIVLRPGQTIELVIHAGRTWMIQEGP